ncbi:enhancer of mRNA-decapping protein 4 homolog isoform X1 [Glossina fuscipes]|uniref:Enhancer of mRNA-decapping protein 4 homolog isoform X1 n=2 Tax=Glossina fuscipes TaxID=7396 RepID=A0A8U0WAQ3_9MUSC|nr:enhancer of mRNA-decapping protein 4 homolog isoform X1 [Glossina fuscipes]
MLVALLAVDAVFRKSLKNFEKRFITEARVERTQNVIQIAHLEHVKNTVSVDFMGKMGGGGGQQSPPAVSNENVADNTGMGKHNVTLIAFKTGDNQCCQEINSPNVKIVSSSGNHDHGSSKVKLKNIVDYKWEVKTYPAHLIAVHIDEKYIAYVINVNKVTRMEGMVRVVNTTNGLRALIKGMAGEVLDLQFAHIEKEHILASIDLNSLYVHKIDEIDGALLCNLIIKIESPLPNYTPKHDKISWCPFIDVPGEDDEDSQLIVWARGTVFQCFNINLIVAEHGIGKIQEGDIRSGFIKHEDKAVIITWVALSPDGSTLGVGSTDGVIRFYQVYIHDKNPRCLHEWKPHNGKSVSSFFFLDNLTKNNTDTYWKYAITGAENNTEFKVWDCGTWNCLQTVNIMAANEEKSLRFIAEIDRTSSYLVISSLETRICYVMQIINNVSTSTFKDFSSDIDESLMNKDTSGSSIASHSSNLTSKSSISMFSPAVYIKSISEFPLNSGILSFTIVDAAVRRYKCANDNYLCDELDDYDEETNSIYCVVVHMYIVQSKSMQECHILYQPTVHESVDIKSTMSSSETSNQSIHSKNSLHNDILNSNSNTIDNDRVNTDDDDGEENDPSVDAISTESNEKNPLEVLLSMASATVVNSQQSTLTSNSTGSTVVAVATGTCGTAVAEGNGDSLNPSPKYTQVNLMTPDAFASTSSASERKTPDNVSSEVLNTILMLATVTGSNSGATKHDNKNLLNLVNNKLIEDQEHQQMQLKHGMEIQKNNFIAIDRNPGRTIGDNLTSGGSSPSREVQEIMSLQDFDKISFSGDELLEEVSTHTTADDVDANTLSVKIEHESSICNTKLSQNSSTTVNWPKIPDVPKVANTKHSAELQNAANLISQAVNASSVSSLSNSHLAPNLGSTNSSNAATMPSNCVTVTASDLNEMNMKMTELIDLVKMQTIQINNLQKEVTDLKNLDDIATTNKNISEYPFKLEMQLTKMLEQYLKRYEIEHKRKLAAFMAEREAQNRELRESIVQIMNQYILTQFGEIVSKVMAIEAQRQLVPMLSAKLDALQHQIQIDVGQKLTAFDSMLKENIAQACKNKSIIDTFGKSVLVGVQGSLQSAFIESMSSTLIPAYEKSSQNMFKQLHEAFSVGIKEFMEQFDNYLQQLQPMHDSTEDILNKFSGFRQHLDSILTKHRNSVHEAVLETRKDIKGLEILLSHQIQEIIRSEVRKSFETQAVALRSQANTPAPLYDLKDTIKHLLMQGQINKAFHQALLANDLNLVEYTLKSADHNAVFTPDCCLEQKVLLSLIQQISADMSNHNEVKQNYLAEALLAINAHDPITREHAPKVLQELFRNCQMFLINYPKSSQCSNVRMLMKAVQAYKSQF